MGSWHQVYLLIYLFIYLALQVAVKNSQAENHQPEESRHTSGQIQSNVIRATTTRYKVHLGKAGGFSEEGTQVSCLLIQPSACQGYRRGQSFLEEGCVDSQKQEAAGWVQGFSRPWLAAAEQTREVGWKGRKDEGRPWRGG